jgi:hypothetical protein
MAANDREWPPKVAEGGVFLALGKVALYQLSYARLRQRYMVSLAGRVSRNQLFAVQAWPGRPNVFDH